MGELSVLLPLAFMVASFLVVPFLGWGMNDPSAQWRRVRSWRGDQVTSRLDERLEMRHRVANGVALLLWLALVVWLFTAAG